jgi:hypothetical protein
MFGRVSDLAEKLATNVSRRAFFCRLGRGALGLAAMVGGIIALPGQARAGDGVCCYCSSPFVNSPPSCRKTKITTGCGYGCVLVDCEQYSICPR